MSESPTLPSLPERGKPDRRAALKGLAAASAVAGASLFPIVSSSAQHIHQAASATPAAAYTPQLITGAARELLEAVCDRIIPRTDTPGAADAGVADQIDWYATRRDGLATAIADALARVEAIAGKPFGALPVDQQDAVLTRMGLNLETADGKAFTLLKNLTIDAYYSSRPGLQTELGWNANTYLPDFPGCTHDHPAEVAE